MFDALVLLDKIMGFLGDAANEGIMEIVDRVIVKITNFAQALSVFMCFLQKLLLLHSNEKWFHAESIRHSLQNFISGILKAARAPMRKSPTRVAKKFQNVRGAVKDAYTETIYTVNILRSHMSLVDTSE